MKDWIWLIWDLLAVVIIVLSVYICAKKGLLWSLISSLCYLVSAVVATILSPRISGWLYTNVISESLQKLVSGVVDTAFQEGASNLAEAIKSLPALLQGFLEQLIPSSDLASQVFGDSAKELILMQLEGMLKEPIIWFVSTILFIVLFIVVSLIVKLVARLFKKVNDIPVVGTVNMVGGGIVGVIQAIVLLVVLVIILNLVVVSTADKLWWLNHSVIDSTFIIRVIYKFLKIPVFI